MSHFSVLVIGDDVGHQLAPYHEFECTGENNEFVQDLDVTEKTRAEYEKHTCRRIKTPAGEKLESYADQFYRDPTPEESKKIGPVAGTGGGGGLSWTSKDWGDGEGYRTKVHFIPEGMEEIEVPCKEVMTFAEFVEYWESKPLVHHGETPNIFDDHKYGYCLLNESGEISKIIDRTNPNRKWDWWQVGGRYAGRLTMRNGEKVDTCTAANVDWEAMTKEKHERAEREWAAHEAGAMKDIDYICGDIRKGDTKETYMGRNAVPDSTFAVVKDGKWYERGKMGWWAVVIDEKDAEQWAFQFQTLVQSLPPQTLLTVVDCHI